VTATDRIAELRAEADRLEATTCTGVGACWCPLHGDCTCPQVGSDDTGWYRSLNGHDCPLHAVASSHAEGVTP
jgi:hypothetical protein